MTLGMAAETPSVVCEQQGSLAWLLGAMCAACGAPFSEDLLLQQFPPPHDDICLLTAAERFGLEVRLAYGPTETVLAAPTPVVVELTTGYAVALRSEEGSVVCLLPGVDEPATIGLADFQRRFTGKCIWFRQRVALPSEPDASATAPAFGFRWFVPELLRHRRIWRDVIVASLVLQLLTLGTPLFTQVIIDKVVVHRTESTLIALGVGMAVFLLFTAVLGWVRQYLVLHTGNRIDAVLGADVFRHTLRLPLQYFATRPTGVIAARFHGVETIREFLASAAITLVLDIPFLLISLAVMLWYSPLLTAIVVGCLTGIVVLSALVAPVFRSRLDEQFLMGARNQAFLTEHVAGIETVKSLQMEPQLEQRYAGYLAAYLRSGFQTRQTANTYQVLSTSVEQAMTLAVLLTGAWIVMHPQPGAVFTIGMLVAFQMFSSRLSQPVMRMVGLWQQFQQARMSVDRLGDLMNAPAEPYRVVPARSGTPRGEVELRDLGFRYGETAPMLYRNVCLTLPPGRVVAIMGPSGCGKSTLTKLLQGFYRPTEGSIRVDGVDVSHLAANELRGTFGVVPQETVLFSGTIFDNLVAANPYATFEQVVQACKMAEVHEVIEALPKGYQTEIGERGVGLSGGQKQRIAIARALLKNPRVLIFDEATSALDVATAEAFAKTVNQLKGRVSMVFVAHALPRSLAVDEIFVVGSGHLRRVAQAGAAA